MVGGKRAIRSQYSITASLGRPCLDDEHERGEAESKEGSGPSSSNPLSRRYGTPPSERIETITGMKFLDLVMLAVKVCGSHFERLFICVLIDFFFNFCPLFSLDTPRGWV